MMARLFFISRFCFTMIATISLAGCGPDRADSASSPKRAEETSPAESDNALGNDIAVPAPTSNEPVSAVAAVFPRVARPGDLVTLVVRVKLAAGWYIYTMQGPTGAARPTDLKLTLPGGIAATDEWTTPDPAIQMTSFGPVSTYSGDITFRRRLRVSEKGLAGPVDLTCDFHYQACDPTRCLPPSQTTLTIPFMVKSHQE